METHSAIPVVMRRKPVKWPQEATWRGLDVGDCVMLLYLAFPVYGFHSTTVKKNSAATKQWSI
jgi:hypothetical protein